MNENKIAKIAVTITQVIKENQWIEPRYVIVLILEALPDCTVEELQEYFFRLADNLGIVYVDVNDIIRQLQNLAINAVTDIYRKSFWQTMGNILYIVGRIASGLLPGKWSEVSKVVLDVYEQEYKK